MLVYPQDTTAESAWLIAKPKNHWCHMWRFFFQMKSFGLNESRWFPLLGFQAFGCSKKRLDSLL